MLKRRWLYTVTDWDDHEEYVDANGEQVCRDEAEEHLATELEAMVEAARRADLWETKQDTLVARVTRHSTGIVRESPNAKTTDSRDVARNPQPGDTVRGRKVTRRSDLWVEYEKGPMEYTVRLEIWTRCVCGQAA